MPSQLYTAVPNDVITAARWNNEFGNLYDNVLFNTMISTGTSTTRAVADRFSDVINVKDFGAVGNGIADDAIAIQTGLTSVMASGKTLYFPAGEYKIGTALSVSSASQPFKIVGDGMHTTTITRGGSIGTPLNISNSSNWTIQDIGFNVNFAAYPTNANHGISFYNGSYCTLRNVYVTDWKNTAILGYTDPDAPSNYKHNLLENCVIDGLDNANNGVLFANFTESGFINVRALNIGKLGSPCYALQFKESCKRCYMIGGYASGATLGVACGNTGAGGDAGQDGVVYGVSIFDCVVGIGLGNTSGYVIDSCNIDMDNDAASLYAVDFGGNCAGHSIRNLAVKNMLSSKPTILFRSGDIDNVVHISTVSNSSGSTNLAVTFSSGALRNSVELEKFVLPTSVSSSTSLVSNSGGATNTFKYKALPLRELQTIASGVITLRDNWTNFIRLDTEGAAGTDDLDTITAGVDGQIVSMFTTNNLRDVVVKHNTGNILLNGAADFTMDNMGDSLTLIYNSGNSKWCELGRGNNA